MVDIFDIKKRALLLAEKTDSNSISPKEVGGIMYDLSSLLENTIRNGGTLGIRKVYASVDLMENDSEHPTDIWGNPLKRGNLVVIYDGTLAGTDNNKVYAFTDPGWTLAAEVDAGYATRSEVANLQTEVQSAKDDIADVIASKVYLTQEQYDALVASGTYDPNVEYNVYEEV